MSNTILITSIAWICYGILCIYNIIGLITIYIMLWEHDVNKIELTVSENTKNTPTKSSNNSKNESIPDEFTIVRYKINHLPN